jgi:hypothetical protein
VAHPQVAAFARLAEGSAKATRSIAGQNTLITRTIHDMAYDPVKDEIVIGQFFAFGLLTFKGDANGDVAPIRKILGPHTQLKNVARMGLDPIHREIFVPQGRSVLVFPADADGDVAPIRVIKGPDTLLGASALTLDPVHDLLIVSGSRPRQAGERGGGGEDAGEGDGEGATGRGEILVFNRTDNGNVKPRNVISGYGVDGATLMTVYPPKGLIIAAVKKGGRSSDEGYVGVWSVNDNGVVPPRWTIGGPKGLLRDTRGVAADPKHKTVIVSDKYVNGVATYYIPEIF